MGQGISRPAAVRHLFPGAAGAGAAAAAQPRRASGSGSSPAEQQVHNSACTYLVCRSHSCARAKVCIVILA